MANPIKAHGYSGKGRIAMRVLKEEILPAGAAIATATHKLRLHIWCTQSMTIGVASWFHIGASISMRMLKSPADGL